MAITTVSVFEYPPHFPGIENGGSALFTSLTINASGDRVAFIIRCPKAGTLDWFEWQAGTVSNNPDNGMRTSFQTVDPTTGLPDGVQDQFRDTTGTFTSNAWQVPVGVMTNDGTNGGTKRTVALGEYLACVIDFTSFVASDVLSIQVINVAGLTPGYYVGNATTGTYAKNTTAPVLALKYSDGTYGEFPMGIIPATTSTFMQSTTFNSGSTPDERALRFQLPISMRVWGFWFRGDIDNATDFVLYDSDGTTPLATYSFDPDFRGQAGSDTYLIPFSASVTLQAATTYRLSIKPTTGSSIAVNHWELNAAALMEGVAGGDELYLSTRTNAGAWSETATIRPVMGLLIDGIDVSAAGGGAHSAVF